MTRAEITLENGKAMTCDDIVGAVARGWCSKKNSHKTMDSDLAWAITDEVLKLFHNSRIVL